MTFNYADLAVILIFVFFVFNKGRRGITHFAVSTVGKIIAVMISLTVAGSVTSMLRQTMVYDLIVDAVRPHISVESAISSSGVADTPIIESIGGIEGIKGVAGVAEHLLANDNNEIYKLFNVQTYNDYIVGYIANMLMNIVSLLAVYLVTSVIIGALFGRHNIFKGLNVIPGFRGASRMLGTLAGVLEATIFCWILVLGLMFFVLQGKLLNIYELVLTSNLAIYFLEYNILASAIFNIKA